MPFCRVELNLLGAYVFVDLFHTLAIERCYAGQELEGDDSETPDVDFAIVMLLSK
jgi:hypothetical protein